MHPERGSDAPDDVDGGIAATALDPAEIGQVNFRVMRELLLGKLSLDPEPAHIDADNPVPVHLPVWRRCNGKPLGIIVTILVDFPGAASTCRPMFNPWAPEHSVLREKVVEHVFLAELSRTLLLDLKMPLEVLRAEFDAFGYDLVIEANGVLRHIQLKATRAAGARASVDIQLALANKPGGCVVWLVVDPATFEPGPFLWFGGRAGSALPPLGTREVRHSRADAAGAKKIRPGLRRVPKGAFERVGTIRELAIIMFGQTEAEYDRILIEYLARSGIILDAAIPRQALDFSSAADLSGIVDAYGLAEDAGLGDPGEIALAMRASAERTGEWSGSALELWITVCMERLWDKWQSEGPIGLDIELAPRPMLAELAGSFGAKLAKLGWPRRG